MTPIRTVDVDDHRLVLLAIRVALDPQGGYRVAARTSFGKVSTELPIGVEGSLRGDAISGKIGDGRCEVELSNRNGNIEIVKGSAR